MYIASPLWNRSHAPLDFQAPLDMQARLVNAMQHNNNNNTPVTLWAQQGNTITLSPRLPFQFIIVMGRERIFLFVILGSIGLMVFYVEFRRGGYLDSIAENSVYVPAMKMEAVNGFPMNVGNAMPRTPAVAEDAVPGLRRRLPQAILIGVAKCGTGESLSRSRA